MRAQGYNDRSAFQALSNQSWDVSQAINYLNTVKFLKQKEKIRKNRIEDMELEKLKDDGNEHRTGDFDTKSNIHRKDNNCIRQNEVTDISNI